ncbi:MFS transporter [Vibrio sp. HA2012]|uniref:MFS transporter n=1 Tax=Vibrio sp. HA2012 TaxID=1971595 RepID=UPI000C2C1418|nr:MFS transporter [Vibrio sp. HA2012]PJC86839.1 MFS transporter [Vibrio sp. HA2012]
MLSALLMPRAHLDRIATRSAFFGTGFVTAAWAAIIPFVKLNVQISDGTMGLMLLCLGSGALLGMPLAGICTGKYGCKPVLLISIVGFVTLFPLLLLINSWFFLAITLILFGVFIGITDCTMNIQAVVVEKEAQKPLMSGFHGFYSLGGMCGALILTMLLSLGLTVMAACLLSSLFVLMLLVTTQSGLRTDKSKEKGPLFALPKGPVLIIGIVCFIFFLAEGTVLDWSGIFLSEYRSIPATSAGLGVACFSVAMTIGRLLGDRAVSFIGAKRMIILGTTTAMLGFFVSLSFDYWQSTLIGYTLIGIGCSNIVPIMFSATGKQNVMKESLAVTAVSTIAYIGVLAGPALVGFGSELFGLVNALYAVVCLIFIAMLLSRRIRV